MSNYVSKFNIDGTEAIIKDSEARSSITSINGEITDIKAKNVAQDSSINGISANVTSLSGQVGNLNTSVTSMEGVIENLQSGVGLNASVISDVQSNVATLSARMDTFSTLPEGSTAGDAELIDIRNGADGVTYSSAGDAVRGQYLKNRNLVKSVPYNIPSSMGEFENSTYAGVTFTWLNDHTCKLNGTATGEAWNRFIVSVDSLGDFVAGKTYHINVKNNTKVGNLYLCIYTWVNDVLSEPMYRGLSSDFTVPSNATGILIRVQGNTGISYSNDYIEFEILSELSPVLEPITQVLSRTTEINNRLNEFGYVQLLGGTYYIGDPVYMTNNTAVYGIGKSTRILKTTGSTYGLFSVENNVQNVTFKNIEFVGSNVSRPTEAPPAVGELAISLKDNAGYVTIDNCHFLGFQRCGIYVGSGYSWLRSLDATNCSFLYCGQGIEFTWYGEYARVTNCHFNECYYGVKVIGGNNNFANCGFDACYIGFMLYDDGTTPSNDGHGSCTACSFNHCYNTAIACFNIDNGYAFVGCEIYFAGIVADNSKGIIFSSCLSKGNETFYVSRNNSVVFMVHCLFANAPTLSEQTGGVFKKHFNYTLSGTSV